MENYIVIVGILLLGALFLAVKFILDRKFQLTKKEEYSKAYYLKDSLMDKYERAFYESLKKQLPENLSIFTKVRIEDFIGVSKKIEKSQHFRGYIKSRHLDFIVCDERMKPVLAIEVDGSSHNFRKTQEVDQRKNQICEAVDLKLERIKVGSNYDAESLRIRNLLIMPEANENYLVAS